VVIRTVIIDDYIRQAIAAGVDTILNLGAGLDTRPYRIDLPSSLRWFEVDFPHMIELKETRLAGEKPSCRLERIKLDLTDRALRRKLFSDVSARSNKLLALTEGVTPCLTNQDVADLADDLRQVEKIGFWITDYFSPEAIRYSEKLRARFMRNAPFQFAPEDWFAFFSDRGWRASEVRYISEEAKRLGRPIPLPFFVLVWFVLNGIYHPAQNLVQQAQPLPGSLRDQQHVGGKSFQPLAARSRSEQVLEAWQPGGGVPEPSGKGTVPNAAVWGVRTTINF
jgi:methyltransferase (TIGR00027 family)